MVCSYSECADCHDINPAKREITLATLGTLLSSISWLNYLTSILSSYIGTSFRVWRPTLDFCVREEEAGLI